jgi:hypothetical protein
MEMDLGQVVERINRWTLRFSKLSPERQTREEPLRAGLLRRILAASFIALIVQAALFTYRRRSLLITAAAAASFCGGWPGEPSSLWLCSYSPRGSNANAASLSRRSWSSLR